MRKLHPDSCLGCNEPSGVVSSDTKEQSPFCSQPASTRERKLSFLDNFQGTDSDLGQRRMKHESTQGRLFGYSSFKPGVAEMMFCLFISDVHLIHCNMNTSGFNKTQELQ